MQAAQEQSVTGSDNAKPPKKRRSLRLPDSYKKEKLKLDLEGKEVYLIRAPADVSEHKMIFKMSLMLLSYSLTCRS